MPRMMSLVGDYGDSDEESEEEEEQQQEKKEKKEKEEKEEKEEEEEDDEEPAEPVPPKKKQKKMLLPSAADLFADPGGTSFLKPAAPQPMPEVRPGAYFTKSFSPASPAPWQIKPMKKSTEDAVANGPRSEPPTPRCARTRRRTRRRWLRRATLGKRPCR